MVLGQMRSLDLTAVLEGDPVPGSVLPQPAGSVLPQVEPHQEQVPDDRVPVLRPAEGAYLW